MTDILDFLSSVRPYLETLYFIAGIVVAFAAIYALKQISILKMTLQVQSKRDALKITSEQCELYFNQIIPLQDSFYNNLEKHSIKYFEGWSVDIENDSISVSRQSQPKMENFEKIIGSLSVLNALESFSAFFVSKVADERVAYDTVGTNFLGFTKNLMPWIIGCRKDGHFKNLTQLFVLWETRRLHLELLQEKRDLNKKLRNTQMKITVPIGAENT
ncbi:TPA: hypothetical protein NJ084_004494 [Vibrio parahaemolyticus]|uniref:DUF4760 domain-containing protein n=1 Tax=Vibrio parahaemolyticus TaxID=670 RepID=UPI000946D106|nr:hypothetical protein [Vibrio parahaemolyticus]OLF44016.1 hypothetical protein BUQ66_17670 [Vibrio parahaemolyticus]HCG5924602.1 hypothetical protein [Vibrio parahaemolyticus]HCM1082169.1 hypothetical protein [Vibrio parahaemolyticus]